MTSSGNQIPLPPAAQSPTLLEPPDTTTLPELGRLFAVKLRAARLLDELPTTRTLGRLALEVTATGWRFPTGQRHIMASASATLPRQPSRPPPQVARQQTRLRPSADVVLLKERLLYLLQPPLENLFNGKNLYLPFPPYPYQLEGIAFLMPRWSALLADEMGLGKTMQTIVALRLLFHAGLIRHALLVCPKPLVLNWARELRQWADEIPFEVIGGDGDARRAAWLVSNCPLKLVNYELLTRDAEVLVHPAVHFDVVVLDEAQRIKNRDSKAAQAARRIKRQRSWALTGTPIENRPEDLVNLFAFIKPGYLPANVPPRRLPELTADCILRRVKEDVLDDLPPKTIRDAFVELTPAQRDAYELAEKEGVVRLNALGDTITVQHVFELIMRLKQICNFDPATGQSAKFELLRADLAEIAASGRKAIIFSQWVEPLEMLADRLSEYDPLLFHGRVPASRRPEILERFRHDRRAGILLMSYGAGSVGLNLQCANYVFLFDRWWNPAVEDQAINRAHRIGQRNPVFVTRFITQNTIEGRISEVLGKKRQLFEDLIGQNSSPPVLGLSQDELFNLFGLRFRPRQAA